MWLLIDIGNTALKLALIDPLESNPSISVLLNCSSDLSINAFMAKVERLKLSPPAAVGIASVVPQMTQVVSEGLNKLWKISPLIISSQLILPFSIDYRSPQTLGADRLSAAVAGYLKYGKSEPKRAIIVISAGTATTFEVISEGIYRGGIIAPGPKLMQKGLTSGTAQLPAVDLTLPPNIVGLDTEHALQSGIMYGQLSVVDGILHQLKQQYPMPFIVATGGWSNFLKTHLSVIDWQEDHLVLAGALALLKLNL